MNKQSALDEAEKYARLAEAYRTIAMLGEANATLKPRPLQIRTRGQGISETLRKAINDHFARKRFTPSDIKKFVMLPPEKVNRTLGKMAQHHELNIVKHGRFGRDKSGEIQENVYQLSGKVPSS